MKICDRCGVQSLELFRLTKEFDSAETCDSCYHDLQDRMLSLRCKVMADHNERRRAEFDRWMEAAKKEAG